MSGIKGRSGRKPSRITDYKRWFDANPDKIVNLLDMLYNKALTDNDREAAIYIIDRVAGRPRQEIDNRTSITLLPTPDDYAMARITLIEEMAQLNTPSLVGLSAGGLAEPESEDNSHSLP